MADPSDPRSPRKSRGGRGDDVADDASAAPESPSDTESDVSGSESPDRLTPLLGREPSDEEAQAWIALSPGLRRRAVDRMELMRRWFGERGGMTADDAAGEAGVAAKRFYQMASAWRKNPGLLAVGVYAAAKPERAMRIDPRVNAALQANVAKVVAADPMASVEALRRELEAVVRRDLPAIDAEAGGMTMPSMNLVRAVVTRELNRLAELKLLGESIALDCVPTTMRKADGGAWVIFCVIDRGTLRILGHALGDLDDSRDGYAAAAADALECVESISGSLPWASATRRMDVVVGFDEDAWADLLRRYRALPRAIEFGAVTNDRRFGSQLRKYVGDRIGRVVLRPAWAKAAPPDPGEGDHVFQPAEAEQRARIEVNVYNAAKPLPREGAGAAGPPSALLEALQFLSAEAVRPGPAA